MKMTLAARMQLRERELILENERLADRLAELGGRTPDRGPRRDTYEMLEKARRAAASIGTTVEEINRMANSGELGEMVRHFCGPAGASNIPRL